MMLWMDKEDMKLRMDEEVEGKSSRMTENIGIRHRMEKE